MIEIYLKTMKKTKRKYQQKEKKIQLQVCDWLKEAIPNLLFVCDKTSGMRLTIGQAMVFKRMRTKRAMPDLYIFCKDLNGKYSALILELKKSRNEIFTKDGKLRNNKHIKEQTDVLLEFNKQGFYADFEGGLEEIKEKISTYLFGLLKEPLVNIAKEKLDTP